MKYIRTYGDYNSWKLDYSDTSRGFRLKPTLYKYSDVGIESKILIETDDPRKHESSTWIHLEFTEATEFSFKISNVAGDDSDTLNYTIDWGDGTVETNTATRGTDGLYTFTHSYVIGTYDMELFGTDRSYMLVGSPSGYKSHFSVPTAVKRVVLVDGVELGTHVFYNCSKLTSINIPEGVTSIGSEVFTGCSSLTSINLPSTLTSIGSSALLNCSKLTSINIPEGVTSIGNSAFYGCSSLTSINIPEGVTSIGNSAFTNCSKLTSINIPEGVTSIGKKMFFSCSSLTSINIPEGVTSIGNYVFGSCTKLTSISSYNATAPTLEAIVFSSMPTNGTLYIKPGATGYDAWLSKLPSGWKIVESL